MATLRELLVRSSRTFAVGIEILPLFAVRTLAISLANPEVLEQETKMTRREVELITRRAKLMGFSNGWIDRYYSRLAAMP